MPYCKDHFRCSKPDEVHCLRKFNIIASRPLHLLLHSAHWPTNSHQMTVPRAYRVNTVEPAPPPGNWQAATIDPHWCHIASTVAYSGSLTYCAALSGTFDWSVVDEVTIIDHFVKWSWQALIGYHIKLSYNVRDCYLRHRWNFVR